MGGSGKAVRTRPDDPFPSIRNQIPSLVNSLLELPDSPVWIHEKALAKTLKLPSGSAFGQRHSLTCIMKGIQKGYCGQAKKGRVNMPITIPDFSQERSDHRISWQYHGRGELFSNGHLRHDTVCRPRWFRVGGSPSLGGETVSDVTTQRDIVEELMGEVSGLDEVEEERRQNNYTNFVKEVDEDGGYRKMDVPDIAYRHREDWGFYVKVNKNFVRDGHVLRRAFKLADLARIEHIMRLMIVASDRYGKLVVVDGQLGIHSSTRPTRSMGLPTPAPPKILTASKGNDWNIALPPATE